MRTPGIVRLAKAMSSMGASVTGKATEIAVDNDNYSAGAEALENCDYKTAVDHLSKALDEESATLSQGSLEIAETRSKLGEAQFQLGLYDPAHDNLNSAYVTMRDKLGPEDETTVRTECMLLTCDSLSDGVQQSLGRLNDAYYHTKSVSLKMSIAQMEAWVCQVSGNRQKAIEWYNILPYWYSEFIGRCNPGCVSLLNNYGAFETQNGHYETAEESFKWALEYWRGYSEKDDALKASIYLNRSALRISSDDCAGAEEDLRKASSIYRSLYGEPNVYTAAILQQQASLEGARGNKDRQLDCLYQAHEQAKSVFGENHRLTAEAEVILSEYCLNAGDCQSALAWANSALDALRNALEEGCLLAASAYGQVAKSELAAGDYAEARKAAEKCVGIRQGILGRDNPLTGQAYGTLALSCMEAADVESATWYAELYADICSRYYEHGTAEYSEAMITIEKVFYEAGDKERVIEP